MAGVMDHIGQSVPGSVRPLQLASAGSEVFEVVELKKKVSKLEYDIAGYNQLIKRLDTFTDEPQWNAMIPLGPLAFFPGQLIHTNDITIQNSPPIASTSQAMLPNEEISESENVKKWKTVKSAKQALGIAKAKENELLVEMNNLRQSIENKQKVLDERNPDGLDWKLNEQGEVVNEEGLPMFDIHEELSPVPDLPSKEEHPAEATAAKPEQKMRYLIKKGGKQVMKPLKVPLAQSAPTPEPTLQSPPKHAVSAETLALLDRLEQEETENREMEQLADEQSSEIIHEISVSQRGKEESDSVVGKLATTGAESQLQKSIDSNGVNKPSGSKPTPSSSSKGLMSSMRSGFLNKAKVKQTPKDSVAASTNTPASDVPSPPRKQVDDSETKGIPPILHQPLHRFLPPSSPICKPTPPSSNSSSRPASPRPDRKVVFDVPTTTAGEKEPKPKRAPIILPPPPGMTADSDTSGSVKEPFQRPIRDTVVENPVKPPSVPKASRTLKAQFASVPSLATPKLTSNDMPIHTLSLTDEVKRNKVDGHATLADLEPAPSDEQEVTGALPITSDEESDSSGFYVDSDNEDEDDDDLDIDKALHAREVALAYHRQRMNVGAGAGTGPLGGNRDSTAFDAWDQPEVPIEATVQGRTPGSGGPSRFRTGRLESTQMIISSMFEDNITLGGPNGPSDSQIDDELTPEEHENIRVALEKIMKSEFDPKGQDLLRPPSSNQPVRSRKTYVDPSSRMPPQVLTRDAISPIGPQAGKTTIVESVSKKASPTESVSAAKPVKLSRFKARQMGLA